MTTEVEPIESERDATEPALAAPPPRRRRLDPKLMLASLGIAIGIFVVVLGLTRSVTGREEQQLPDAIEGIAPIRGATQVLSQAQVFADLLPGYDMALVLNGIELDTFSLADIQAATSTPADGGQVSEVLLPPAAIKEPGNNTITYTPAEGGPIEAFDTGLNTATVIYWKIDEGRDRARSYTWTFTVV